MSSTSRRRISRLAWSFADSESVGISQRCSAIRLPVGMYLLQTGSLTVGSIVIRVIACGGTAVVAGSAAAGAFVGLATGSSPSAGQARRANAIQVAELGAESLAMTVSMATHGHA